MNFEMRAICARDFACVRRAFGRRGAAVWRWLALRDKARRLCVSLRVRRRRRWSCLCAAFRRQLSAAEAAVQRRAAGLWLNYAAKTMLCRRFLRPIKRGGLRPMVRGRPAGLSVVNRWRRGYALFRSLRRSMPEAPPSRTFLEQAAQKIHGAAYLFCFLSQKAVSIRGLGCFY